jgi:hypothetical protein
MLCHRHKVIYVVMLSSQSYCTRASERILTNNGDKSCLEKKVSFPTLPTLPACRCHSSNAVEWVIQPIQWKSGGMVRGEQEEWGDGLGDDPWEFFACLHYTGDLIEYRTFLPTQCIMHPQRCLREAMGSKSLHKVKQSGHKVSPVGMCAY